MGATFSQHDNHQTGDENISPNPVVEVIIAKDKRHDFSGIAIIVSSILSMLSIILVFFTLLEMKQERNTAYQPELVLGTSSVGMLWDERGKLMSNTNDSVFSLAYYEDENTYVNSDAFLKLYNIGSGNAKNLTIEWDFGEDLPRLVEIINSNPHFDASIDAPFGITANYCVNIKNPEDIYWNEGYGIPYRNEKLDYLLSGAQENKMVEVPGVYLWIYRLLTVCYSRGEHFDLIDIPNTLPSIHLLISYFDIQGNKYSKRFEITATFELMDSGDTQGVCLFTLCSTEETMGVSLTHTYYGAYDK